MTHDELKRINKMLPDLEKIVDIFVLVRGVTNGDIINKIFDAETSSNIKACSTEYWWNSQYRKSDGR